MTVAEPLRNRVDLTWPCETAAGNARLQRFEAFWRAACGDKDIPPRAALDPTSLPRDFLGWLILSERMGPRAYRYRLFGSNLVRLIGRDLTDMAIDTLSMDGSTEPFLDMLEDVVAAGQPVYLSGSIFWEGREHRRFQQVTVPYRGADGAMIVCTFVDLET